MKILFFGDSITDAHRNRENPESIDGMGYGYVRVLADRLVGNNPNEYEILNRGISGNRVVDLYARIKSDCWNLKPDLISILIGVNDVWHEITNENGVELDRFETVYRMIIEDTRKALPDTKMILCEPFVLKGVSTKNCEEIPDRYERFLAVYDYAKVVKKLADEYGLLFVALQEKLTEGANKNGVEYYLNDGVHPWIGGATLIADEWMKVFKEYFDKK